MRCASYFDKSLHLTEISLTCAERYCVMHSLDWPTCGFKFWNFFQINQRTTLKRSCCLPVSIYSLFCPIQLRFCVHHSFHTGIRGMLFKQSLYLHHPLPYKSSVVLQAFVVISASSFLLFPFECLTFGTLNGHLSVKFSLFVTADQEMCWWNASMSLFSLCS